MTKNYPTNAVFYLEKTFNIFLFICFMLVASTSFGQTSPISYTSPGTQSFTIPAGVSSITVQAWGAGENGRTGINGGGGGGAYAESTISVTAGQTYTIIIGDNGYPGGNSSFALSSASSTLIIKAEGGGQSGNNRGGRDIGSIGTIKYSGGNGYRDNTYLGGGGGSAGSLGNGNGANYSTGGSSGSGVGGSGGNAQNPKGSDGSSPGGGGGAGNSSGGNGGNGRVILSWVACSTASPTGSSLQSFCSTNSSTVANLTATGTAIKWYANAVSGSALASNTVLVNGNHYYASQTISGCESSSRLDVTVVVTAPPTTTGTTICAGGTGTLTASGSCSSFVGTQTATGTGGKSNSTSYNGSGNSNISIDFPALPSGATVTSVKTIITYTSNSPSWTNELRIEATPPTSLGGTQNELQPPLTSNAAGTITNGEFRSWGTGSPVGSWLFRFRETLDDSSIDPDASISNISIIVTYTIPSTIDWYTAASGGTYIGSGASFNPVGKTNSGLANTNSAGVFTYYAACSSNPDCRTAADFVIYATDTAPAIGTRTQPTCTTATGSVVLEGLPPEWELTQYPGGTKTTGTGTSTTISGLSPGTYTYSVVDTRKGLKGEYFNSTVTGASPPFPTTPPTLTRIDPTVEFDWKEGSPDPLINNNNFLVRWSGQVQPLHSENYTFTTYSDDGVRLWVNGVKLFEDWNDHGADFRSGSITLTAGVKYNIVLEYYENAGSAVAELRWSSLTQNPEVIQQSQLFPSAICGSPASANVVINAQPATPVAPTAPVDVTLCETGTQQTLTATATVPSGSTITWYDSATAGNIVNPATLVSTVAATKTLYGQTSNGTCSSLTRTAVVLKINAAPAAPTAPVNVTVCETGTQQTLTATATVPSSSTITWYDSATAGNIVNPATLVSTVVATKTLYGQTSNGTCSSLTRTAVVLKINATPERPTVGTITQPDCIIPTGSVVLSGLPETWTLVRSDGTSSTTTSGTGTTTTISELAAGSYTYTVSNGTCTSSATAAGAIVINAAITNTWDGTTWSTGSPPTSLQVIEFTSNYDSSVNLDPTGILDGCSCIVNDGAKVDFREGHTLKIQNQVEVLGTGIGAGTLTFENKASLVQINDNASNLGNIIYKRTTPEILKTDYVYWSSPVSLAALKAIQTGTLYYSFNGSGNSWVNANANTIMNTGKGYIVRGAGTWFDKGNVTLTANFVGVPNNGVIDVTIVGAGKNNLIGNPYPSAIDGDAFLAANTDVPGGPTDVLEGALYFWTHKSAIQLASGITNGTAGSGAYAYTSDDYSPFTKVGGTNSVTGNIAAGQSFFARGSSTTGKQAKFFNSMRLDGDNILDNSGFLKPASASKTEKITATNKIEKSRIWLNLTNTQGAFKQMLLGYMTGATDNYDRGYDALSFNGNSFINFYSINNTSLLTIQGRALPIQQTDVVPLGYSSTIAGDFSISIDKTDGALSTMAVFLEDKLTNTTHNLKKGAYTFTTEKGTFNDRFVLSYVDKTTLATDDFQVVENQVVITSKNKEININASTNYIDKVFVYDVTGKQIFLKSKIDKNEFTISNLGSTNHVLVVKVLLQDNSIVTKKIIF